MKKNNIFWISYSDLMTSLFFIMLVLFVLSVGYLNKKQKVLINEIEGVNKLLNLEKQFEPLIKDNSFKYLPDCKKFIVRDLMGIEIFEPNQFVIKPEYISTTIKVGYKIENFLEQLTTKNPDLSYLLVIEGNMANTFDKRINKDDNYGYLISYQRALSVYNLWLKNNINFRKYNNVEVMLCGSGFNGLCRDEIEENNKRFSIQIIPKVSK
ncbi:MAG TPA: hypothetical protein P5085_02580 [Paludibacteraceae bacterium]|nr:hypothetical protein [Paludibacteraceae bacterium]HRT78117.1 hypothetical protein [Paludibacteraceae bacterium]